MAIRKRENLWGEVILNYLEKECVYCGDNKKLNIHHQIPLHLGGKNIMSNLEIVCQKCHFKLHNTWRKFMPQNKKGLFPCKRCEKDVLCSKKSKNPMCNWCKYIINKKKL